LVITSSVDPEINIKTIQQGADDFLTKPFSVDQLIVKIRAALRVVNLIHESIKLKDAIAELKEDMEKDAEAMIDHIKTFQAIRMPELVKKLPRIVEAAEWIAFQLAETEKEVKNIKRAAEICFCGKLYLNEKLVEQPVMIKGLTPYKIMSDVPNFSRDLLKPIRNTKEVDNILYYIYENLDGSGFPEKKKSWEIPLGSRILRVAIEFEELLKKNFDNPGKTIEAMLVEAKRLYDHRVLAFYDQFLGSKEVSRELGVKGREFTVRIHELDENMMTARHIITESGLILVAPNIGLNEERIERIRMINKTDNILGKIYIRNK
jgi:response regulator RpfG family c-di-GMP phosphodiesterase